MKKIFTILCSIVCFYSLWTASIFAGAPTAGEERNQRSYPEFIPPDELKEDLDFLFKTIEEVHPNMYAYTSEEEFIPMREQLYKSINRPMIQLEFYKFTAPIVASLKSGHTFVFPPVKEFSEYVKTGGKVFPLSLNWNGEKAILADNYGPTALPIGGTMLSINGEDASEVVNRLAQYFPAERRSSFPWQLERDELLRCCIWLEYGPIELLNIRIRAIDAMVNNYTIKFVTLDEIKAKENSDKGKNSYQYFPQHNTFLIKLDDWSSVPDVKRFCEEVFQKLIDSKTCNLVIDIRNNPGGNSSCAEVFIEYLTDTPYCLFEKAGAKLSKQFCDRSGADVSLDMIGQNFLQKGSLKEPTPNPLRFNGSIYLLTGVRSTSTSTAFAAAVKHFSIGKLIGEEPTEPLTTYGHALSFILPNSGLQVFSACQVYVCAGSKNDSRGVIPDYEVKQTPEDTAKGVDTVMEFTLNLIKDSNSTVTTDEAKE